MFATQDIGCKVLSSVDEKFFSSGCDATCYFDKVNSSCQPCKIQFERQTAAEFFLLLHYLSSEVIENSDHNIFRLRVIGKKIQCASCRVGLNVVGRSHTQDCCQHSIGNSIFQIVSKQQKPVSILTRCGTRIMKVVFFTFRAKAGSIDKTP